MSKPRPLEAMPITIDEPIPVTPDYAKEDARVGEYALKFGIPTIVHQTPAAAQTPEAQEMPDDAPVSEAPQPPAAVQAPEAPQTPAVAQAPEAPLHVTVPDHVMRALRVKAAEQGVSVRYLVLKALRDTKTVQVPEAALVADRRSKRAVR